MKLECFCKDAGDLYRIAVLLAGFNAGEVMKEITRIQGRVDRKISIPTVEKALQNIREKYMSAEEKQQRKEAVIKLGE